MRNYLKYASRTFVVLLVLGTQVARADQNDPRLDDLFDRLKTQSSVVEQQIAIGEIWSIWYESGSEEIDSKLIIFR